MKLRTLTALPGIAIFLALFAGGQALGADKPVEAQTYAAKQVRADFDELYERLQATHYDLYARRSKPDFDARFKSLRGSFDTPMKRFDIQTRFQDFIAYGNVAHARIDFPMDVYRAYRAGGGKVFPLRVRIVNGAARVSSNQSGLDAISLGDEIVAFDGQPGAAWLSSLRRHLSADNDYMAYAMLESLLPAVEWLEHRDATRFHMKLRTAQGKTYEVVVPARSRDEMQASSEKLPKTFELDWDKRESRMLQNGVAYLRPGPFYNNDPGATNMWDATAYSVFIDAAFWRFIEAGAKSLVIDLRDNPGGDNSFSDPMVSWFATKPFRFASDFRIKVSQAAIDTNRKRLVANADDAASTSHKLAAAYATRKPGDVFSYEIPLAQPRPGTRFQGKVFLLINRHSYSNTVSVAALAQDYGFATILGEETSDLATTYGAMEEFELSRTGVTVGFPKAYIIRPSGATDARGVRPDIAIDTPTVPTQEDTVLARAAEIAGKAGG
ncbi:S41 family peptidase [Dokdonella soli]|uniref:S41 family peptidase n=1 Tax=Dokdonella soli TaxID=529810 RepID=A0ABN1IGC3_9GAMM